MVIVQNEPDVGRPVMAQMVDVVVVGGGGHVGLPLSLALADAGLRVGIYDTNEATVARIGAARCRSSRTAPTSCSRRSCRPGA